MPAALLAYVVPALLAAAAFPLAPAGVRPLLFFLIGSSSLLPAGFALRRREGPVRLIFAGLAVINVGGLWAAVQVAFTDNRNQASLGFIVAGHLLLLAAALWIVLRRGRGDVGGILDAVVMAVGLASLVWAVLLQPRIDAGALSPAARAGLLVLMLCLAGMLGALARVERAAREPLLALRAFLVVLPLAMVGNASLVFATTGDPLVRPGWIDALFLAGYIVAGAGVADRSMVRLLQPGPVPVDRLGPRRLAFLGGALALNPVVAGVQQLTGRPVDAVLLALGTVVVVPLVMLRIGRLAAQRSRAEAALAHEATHDALTGLANRKRFLAVLDAELAAGSAPLIYFCDLNGFKAVNDRLGHVAGDELLRLVAERLAACVREGDTLARYGGDEFVLLCPPAGGSVVARIDAAFAEPFEVAGEPADIGLSIGVVRAEPGADAVSLLRRADGAMYDAKAAARTRAGRVSLVAV
ncbi:diguanylate cyclase domain-containing protein [Actinoplanes sp. URMC 104]|uniref:diguanylate cyclase domain-containing protein n=1 Tax=Actinoplanes sp. URMC 104 TaxID=3423409 RepID=UPI003F1A887B